MSGLLNCFYCGSTVDPAGDHYRHVTGWEKPGRGLNSQSGSSLVLREPVRGEVACVLCIVKLRNGVHLKQETLL